MDTWSPFDKASPLTGSIQESYETHFTRLAGNSQVEPIVLNRRFSWKFRAISALNWSTAGDKEIQIRGIFVGCRRITAERGWPFVSSGSATLDVPN